MGQGRVTNRVRGLEGGDSQALGRDADVGEAIADHLVVGVEPFCGRVHPGADVQPFDHDGPVEAGWVRRTVDDYPGGIGRGRRWRYLPLPVGAEGSRRRVRTGVTGEEELRLRVPHAGQVEARCPGQHNGALSAGHRPGDGRIRGRRTRPRPVCRASVRSRRGGDPGHRPDGRRQCHDQGLPSPSHGAKGSAANQVSQYSFSKDASSVLAGSNDCFRRRPAGGTQSS